MADYCTLSDVKSQLVETLGSSTDETFDTLISSLVTSASRAIDGYLGVWDNYFHPSTDAETRYYTGTAGYSMEIDDFVSISSLGVSQEGGLNYSDYQIYSTSDYFVIPFNTTPHNKIELDVVNSSVNYFTGYQKSVRVTGIFGYSLTPPQDVKQACIIQALRYFMRAKSAYQDAGANPALGQMFYVRELDPDVKLLLNRYVMHRL